MPLTNDILRRIRGHGRGFVFTASDFDDLGTRPAVDQALTRLVRDTSIRRVDRGLYDFPRVHRFAGPLWPSTTRVVDALARQTDSHVKASGPLAANILGLTSQVPAHPVFLTDGRARNVRVGKLRIALKRAGRVDMLLPDTAAGLAIVAMRHLGRDQTTGDVLAHLSSTLDSTDKAKLHQVRRQLPGWLAVAVDQIGNA